MATTKGRPSRKPDAGGHDKLDAWCPSCEEVRKHTLLDPGSCKCDSCGHIEQMLSPLGPRDGVAG